MTSPAVLAIALIVAAAPARAEPERPDHAESSTTVYLSSAWSPGPTVPIRIGVDAVLRAIRNHFAFEVRLGAGGAASVIGLGGILTGHVGLSIGAALPVRRSVVLTPMVAYDGFGEWEQHGATVTVSYFTFEIPLSIVLDRGVVIEPFLQVGFARYQSVFDPVVIAGPRLGIVF